MFKQLSNKLYKKYYDRVNYKYNCVEIFVVSHNFCNLMCCMQIRGIIKLKIALNGFRIIMVWIEKNVCSQLKLHEILNKVIKYKQIGVGELRPSKQNQVQLFCMNNEVGGLNDRQEEQP